MADPIAYWQAEHIKLGRLFALLQKQIDVFHTGKRPNYELMLDIVSYLRDYADQFHHPREEVAFKPLAKHCPDLVLALDRLTQEHRVIAHAGEALRLLLQAIISGAIIPRTEAVRLTPPLSRVLRQPYCQRGGAGGHPRPRGTGAYEGGVGGREDRRADSG